MARCLNLASVGTMFLPSSMSIYVSNRVQEASDIVIEVHARDR